MNKPTVVCLCGSIRFKDQFLKAQVEETLNGKIVLTPGVFDCFDGVQVNQMMAEMLKELHLRKIDLADEVLIINVGKYIGQTTSEELEYAKKNGKTIRFLEEIEEKNPEKIDERKCPVCGEQAVTSCRCPRLDCFCKNGHSWHTCVKHQKIVLGESDHSRPTFECTCLE